MKVEQTSELIKAHQSELIFSRIKPFLKGCEAFQKIQGVFKTLKEKLSLFPVM
jgi:hypothetical protein